MQQDLPVEHHAIGGGERGDSSLHGTLDGSASCGRFGDNSVEVTIDGARPRRGLADRRPGRPRCLEPDGRKVG
jgi:hypothetical protein